jgi:O-antigen/teichoic acid export membrane protein
MPDPAQRNAAAPASRAPARNAVAHLAQPARLLSFARRVLPLAIAQLIGRLGSLILAAYTGRVLGAAALGDYALGRTLVGYAVISTDMGATDIGVRLVARNREMTPLLMRTVQRKRLILAVLAIASLGAYALLGPVPRGSGLLLACFALGALPWCLRLDWLFWGLERFSLVSMSETLGNVVYVGSAIGLMALMVRAPLYGVAAAGALAILSSTALTRVCWRRALAASHPGRADALPAQIAAESGWWPVLLLGGSRICNILFQSIDVVLLGAMVTARELGQYSAAYRVLVIVFGIYYLATSAAFPALARIERSRESRVLITAALAASAMAGVAVALAIRLLSFPIIVTVFGPGLVPAAGLLRVLCFAIPFEFVATLVSTVLIADGSNGLMAVGRLAGLIANVALNLVWIPRWGAYGAAWATVASYTVLVAFWTTAHIVGRGPIFPSRAPCA